MLIKTSKHTRKLTHRLRRPLPLARFFLNLIASGKFPNLIKVPPKYGRSPPPPHTWTRYRDAFVVYDAEARMIKIAINELREIRLPREMATRFTGTRTSGALHYPHILRVSKFFKDRYRLRRNVCFLIRFLSPAVNPSVSIESLLRKSTGSKLMDQLVSFQIQYILLSQAVKHLPRHLDPFTDVYNSVIGPQCFVPFEAVNLDVLTEQYIKPQLARTQRRIATKLANKKLVASITTHFTKLRVPLGSDDVPDAPAIPSAISTEHMDQWRVSMKTYATMNLVVGELSPDSLAPNTFLLASKVIGNEATTDDMTQIMIDAINTYKLDPANIILLITEPADHFDKWGQAFAKCFCPNMISLKCINQTLGEIQHEIREHYSAVNKLVEEMNTLMGWPDVRRAFKDRTKLDGHKKQFFQAVIYYSENYATLEKYFSSHGIKNLYGRDMANSLKKLLTKSNKLWPELIEVKSKFAGIFDKVRVAMEKGAGLATVINAVESLRSQLERLAATREASEAAAAAAAAHKSRGSHGKKKPKSPKKAPTTPAPPLFETQLSNKINQSLTSNQGYQTLRSLLSRTKNFDCSCDCLAKHYRFAPITSVYLPMVFPQFFELLKAYPESFPAEYYHIYSVIYAYEERMRGAWIRAELASGGAAGLEAIDQVRMMFTEPVPRRGEARAKKNIIAGQPVLIDLLNDGRYDIYVERLVFWQNTARR